MDSTKQNILRSNHCLIVDTLDLKHTSILDELQEDDILSSDEQERILSRGTSRDQNAHLLFILKRKSNTINPFDAFVKAVAGKYNFLAEKLSAKSKKSSHRSVSCSDLSPIETDLCCHCMLMRNLIPKDISHYLFQEGVLSDDEVEEVNNDNICRRSRVRMLIETLEVHDDKDKVYMYFHKSLQRKYKYISDKSSRRSFDAFKYCTCGGHTGTVRDSYQNTERIWPYGTSKFANTEVKAYSQTAFKISGSIPKCKATNTRTMRLCGRVWYNLYQLRERGNWKRYNSVTQTLSQSYVDNPDVQMIILCSNMFLFSHYQPDVLKAKQTFTDATALLPKTSMPNWHIVPFLAMKIGLNVRNGNLERAQHCIEEARQAISILSPGLVCGIVSFSEALYLEELLRCTQNGSRYESIREQVKTCFLTARMHYREDVYFDLRSVTNKINLWLALFALGIDFRKVRYIGHKNLKACDVALAEHYLDMFENDCWELSTNWSEMLFFIARAETQRQRSNLRRCIDYIEDACTCADKGKFEEQKQSIESYLKTVHERYEVKEHTRMARNQVDETSLQEELDSLTFTSNSNS